MEHVVFFPAPDGSPAFRRLASLEEAVRLVEHLRNVEGVSSVSVHALTEVPLSFRAYYRVEMPGAALLPDVAVPLQAEPVATVEPVPALALVEDLPAADLPAAELPAAELPAEPMTEAPLADREPEPALSASNGHATPASLGFFA